MVHNVYAALPSIERALLELDPSSPSKPQLVPKNVAPEPFGPFHKKNAPRLDLGRTFEVRAPDASSLVNKSTPLREVLSATPLTMPRFG